MPQTSSNFPQTSGQGSANSQSRGQGARDSSVPSSDSASQASGGGQQSAQQSQQGQDSPAGQQGRRSAPISGSGSGNASGDISDQGAGAQSGFPRKEQPGDNNGNRDISTGDLNSGQGGNSGSNGGLLENPSGDYSLDTLPNNVLSGNSSMRTQNTGPMTSVERAKVLDERLRRGYETFDGFILSEREQAQNESNAAGSAQPGGDAGGGNTSAQPQTLPEAGAPSGAAASRPSSSSSPPPPTETFPPPEDIPSGRDDDVVARQLREAAMSEPDLELREALWDEYRNYTGIGEGEEQ